MAFRMGLLGKKIGMTQTFTENGDWVPVTVVEVGPNVVLECKNTEGAGYSGIKLGFDEQKPHRVNRAGQGVFAKAGTTPKRCVGEVRLSERDMGQFKQGQTITVDQVFQDGQLVDVVGTSQR